MPILCSFFLLSHIYEGYILVWVCLRERERWFVTCDLVFLLRKRRQSCFLNFLCSLAWRSCQSTPAGATLAAPHPAPHTCPDPASGGCNLSVQITFSKKSFERLFLIKRKVKWCNVYTTNDCYWVTSLLFWSKSDFPPCIHAQSSCSAARGMTGILICPLQLISNGNAGRLLPLTVNV